MPPRPQHEQDLIELAQYSAPVHQEGCFICANAKSTEQSKAGLFIMECTQLKCLVSVSGTCRHFRYDPMHTR